MITDSPLQYDATDLSAAIARRQLSCCELMQATLEQIERINPSVNAIVALRPADELMAAARRADAEPARGWLHGIPMAVKDLVDTAGIVSAHGSPLLAAHVPDNDDLLAQRLRDAGAILIGKTNTPEFGIGSHTYNAVYGITRNPYDTRKSAGGSSGGAAAALATRMVSVADGSDMMGSLRNPAAWCNVYGFRPGYGTVPAEPSGDTFLHQLATAGPMARSIRDLAQLLDTLAVADGRLPHARHGHGAFARATAGGGDDGSVATRIGWMGDWQGHYPLQDGVDALCRSALGVFTDIGASVEPCVPAFDPERLWESWTVLRSFAIVSALQDHYTNLDTRHLLKPEAVWEIERGLGLSALQVHAASVIRSEWFTCCAHLFKRFDVLALPSAQCFAFDATLHWPGTVAGHPMSSYHRWMEIVIPASLAGLPALALPAGFSGDGLPMGLQLIGARGSEARLLALAERYHQVTDWPGRRPPI